MGLLGSKYSSNDYELAIKSSKELEYILISQFQSTGRGLHEHITSVSDELPDHLIKQMRYLATIRNKLIHEGEFNNIPDRDQFIAKFEQSAKELDEIIKGRGGESICIIQ